MQYIDLDMGSTFQNNISYSLYVISIAFFKRFLQGLEKVIKSNTIICLFQILINYLLIIYGENKIMTFFCSNHNTGFLCRKLNIH